jgi:5,10-methylenetetrahydrofolate reductase
MSAELVCITLIVGRALRDELLDYLSEQQDLISGFTASDAAGHGPDVRLQTPAERVKGNADELMVRTILQVQQAAQLLERLKAAFAGSRIVYWIMPVSEFGVIDVPNR